MKPIRKLILTGCLAFFLESTSAEPLGQQFTFTSAGGTTWNIDWNGVSGRTYFIQWSLNLETWAYAPVVEFETSLLPYGTNAQGAEEYFVRLRYYDADWVQNLQEARDADFDGDGIPNWYEVEELFSDPFDYHSSGGDSDLDGLPDGWELYHFGDLVSAGAAGNPDADLLNNAYEAALGTDPNAGLEIVTESEVQLFIPN